MTDRRSFFKSLTLLAGATSVSPMIFLPKFEPVRWKRMVNPDWINAPYELRFSELYGEWKIDYLQTQRFIIEDGIFKPIGDAKWIPAKDSKIMNPDYFTPA